MSEDAKADVPPPRYIEEGGWRRLVCDEQEWLARPASWGIDKMPDETRGWKQKLFEVHLYGWLADRIGCKSCRPYIRRAMTADDQLSEQVLDEWRAAAHSDDGCDAGSFRHHIHLRHRGLITWAELFEHFMSALYERAEHRERDEKCRTLVLELVGPNPFRPTLLSSAWRTDTAVSLARTMYESREFSTMPILADALQDAGCDNADILDHCRDTTLTHVRGCWVVDLVLDKH